MNAPGSDGITSLHLQRAQKNDRESVAWLVARYTPLLLVQAQHRLSPSLRRLYDVGDVVADVWITVLGALPRLEPSQSSLSRAFLKYSSTVLIHRIRDLLEKHVINRPVMVALAGPDTGATGAPTPAVDSRGVITHLVAEERKSRLFRCLEELDPVEREIVVLRGIEERPHKEIAELLGVSVENSAVRYHRALKRLREQMPDSAFDDLEA
jgi:RNA polymerase sigma factor (sigma-70 family)